jgi:hypothetical protein
MIGAPFTDKVSLIEKWLGTFSSEAIPLIQ